MEKHGRVRLFDDWADRYDQDIRKDGAFPHDGYELVLDEIARAAGVEAGMTILDVGIGTGNLASRFVSLGCSLWGIDFSSEMLVRARERLPQAVLLQVDVLGDWPPELHRPFDRVTSAYLFHEFDLPTKLSLLRRLALHHLVMGGRIVVGDVSFSTAQAREDARLRLARLWDEEEFYWAADETKEACKEAGIRTCYRQVSSCGGVFSFEPLLFSRLS